MTKRSVHTGMSTVGERQFLIAAIFVVLALFVATPQARADFKVCNKTTSQVGIAIGYKDDSGWKTEGWWNLTPGNCEAVLTGELVARYYYVYAVDYDLGGEWGGQAVMCTRDRVFTIRGFEGCVGRGFEETGFFEIDTGDSPTWTVQLSEPSQQGTGGK